MRSDIFISFWGPIFADMSVVPANAVATKPPTSVEAIASIIVLLFLALFFVGSFVSWQRWLAGRRVKLVKMGPLATVGFVDIAMTFALLVCLFVMAASIWRLGIKQSLGFTSDPLAAVAIASKTPTETEILETVILETESSETSEAPPIPDSSSKITTKKPETARTLESFVFVSFASVAQVICVAFASIFVLVRTGCKPDRLGWRLDRWKGDLLAGLQVYLMMTPILYLFNGLCSALTKVEYHHPIQEMVKQYPWMVGIAFWLVSVVAPISEEFAFRGLLIGWFESIHFAANKAAAGIFGMTVDGSGGHNLEANESTTSPSMIATEETRGACQPFQPPWWPAIVSGILFGLVHFEYGVSWISLIGLGIVLGRLYQSRQSLLPVITVHFLFNSTSILFLSLGLLLQPK
jgi:membrane protease YdiL (CAAX protease family)